MAPVLGGEEGLPPAIVGKPCLEGQPVNSPDIERGIILLDRQSAALVQIYGASDGMGNLSPTLSTKPAFDLEQGKTAVPSMQVEPGYGGQNEAPHKVAAKDIAGPVGGEVEPGKAHQSHHYECDTDSQGTYNLVLNVDVY